MLNAILRKECLLIFRDIHALLVLFVMPVAFILIMSLSLQDKFNGESIEKINIGLHTHEQANIEHPIFKDFSELEGFNVVIIDNNKNFEEIAKAKSLSAIINIPQGFLSKLDSDEDILDTEKIILYFSPTSYESLRSLLKASISRTLAAYQVGGILAEYINNEADRIKERNKFLGDSLIIEKNLFNTQDKKPNSVEQSVPAWLIFSMFFVVIPLSTTFIIERQQGTLLRLKTFPTPNYYFFCGKILPYIFINIIQVILMFLVGILLLPLLGGEGITLNQNAWLLLPISIAISFNAICFALLVATFCNTTEQATSIGGVSNLIFAAIGGVMIPTFVMPQVMQKLSTLSPMNWGLEAYLNVILRQGTLGDVLPEIFKLLIVGICLLAIALIKYESKPTNY